MKIFLIGYMGSGKSTLGKILANNKEMNYLDLDDYIEENEEMSIPQIFESKGEIYFRKRESHYLNQVLEGFENTVISLGGGTPCYSDAMQRINNAEGISVYINVGVSQLTERLWVEREQRPVLKHQETKEKLEEFVRKHLFERSFYYNQADVKIHVKEHSVAELVTELEERLF